MPEQRLVKLTAELSHAKLLGEVMQHGGAQELVKVMQAEANRRRKGQNAIHWDSTPDEFAAHEKRSLYASGYIQGLEFSVNVLLAIPQQIINIEAEIKTLAARIKADKRAKRQ